jgi:chemotaxis signal transduction protein
MEKINDQAMTELRSALRSLSESAATSLNKMAQVCADLQSQVEKNNYNFLAIYCGEIKSSLAAIEKMNSDSAIPSEDLFILDFLLSDVFDTFESYLKSVKSTGDSEDLKKKKSVPLGLLAGWKPASSAPAAPKTVEVAHAATTVQEKRADGVYLLFKYRKQDFAVDVSYVKEIVKSQSLTTLPKSKPNTLGIINLRGVIFPVLNIDHILGFKDIQKSDYIIICDIESYVFGLPVDKTDQVITLPGNSFHPLDASSQSKDALLQQYSVVNDKTIFILDLSRVAA